MTLYWEDFAAGSDLEVGHHTFTKEAIVAFARDFDPQPFHIDPVAAKGSAFGGLVASGWHTCAIAMRLMCDAYVNRTVSLGSPGVEAVRWPHPVRPGDTVTYRRRVVESRASKSKPHMGLVRTQWIGVNQRGETVLEVDGWGMFGRRPAPDASAVR